MTPDTIPQTVLFPGLFNKPLFAQFHQEQASSDGGAILLKAAERTYGLVKALAGCLFDTRAPDKIRHTLADLFGQRIFGIACGHPDCNDAERLSARPHPQAAVGPGPGGGRVAGLAADAVAVRECGQPLCALPSGGRVGQAGHRAASPPVGWAGRGASRSTWTRRTTRRTGRSSTRLFNAYYDNWCYLPLLAFVTFDRESEQYLCAALLRHGKAVASEGDGRSVVAVAAAAAQGVPAGALSRPSRRRLCQPGGLRLPGGAATARVRGRDGEERGVGAARRTGHAGVAGAQLVQRTDRARPTRTPTNTRPARGTTRAAS